jgi:dolichol kinase
MKRPQLSREQFDNVITLVVYSTCWGTLCWALWLFRTDPTVRTQIITIIGGTLAALVGFRWGSSRSANRKDETINNLLSPPDGKTELKSETPKDEKFNT